MIKRMIILFQLLGNKFVVSVKRFPETLLLATATVATLICMNHLDYEGMNILDNLIRIAMVLALGIPLTLCIKVFFERRGGVSRGIKFRLYIGVLILLALYYFFMLDDMNDITISRYIAFTISLYLAFSFIPYFFRKENYDFYVVTLFNRFVTTYLYSVILFLGLVAIISTINILFMANISSIVYFDLWLLVAGIFAPIFFLADIPEYGQNPDIENYSKVLKVLLLYIIMPLTVAYSLILYAYFIKILVTGQWPEGVLANLVLWFSIISAIVIFFIYSLRDTNRWAKTFISFFPVSIIPLLVMMFVSLGIRVNAYGVTENRYYVLIAGLWVTGCMIYYSLNKRPRNIVITVSLAVVSIAAVIGPWSSFSISKLSQNKRFENILKANNMLTNEGVIERSLGISNVDKEEISSILLYFQNKHSFDDVKYLPRDFKIDQMGDIFGFEFEGQHRGASKDKYFSHTVIQGGDFLNIRSYDYFIDNTHYGDMMLQDDTGFISIRYSGESRMIEIMDESKVIYNQNIDDIVKIIHKNNVGQHEVEFKEMSYIDKSPSVEVLYVFDNISGIEKPDGEITVHSPIFYMFVRIM